jgi:capsular polysaccharide transport system permease protein
VSLSDDIFLGSLRSGRSISIVDHIFIVRALVLRDLRLKYMSRPMGFFLEFLRPTLVDGLHLLVFSVMGRPMAANIPLEQFIWAGFMIWFIFSTIANGLLAPRTRPPLPNVSAMHMRLATATWPIIFFTFYTYFSVALMMLFGDNIQFPDVPLTALVVLITASLAFGWGLAIEGLERMVPLIQPLVHFIPWLLYLTAGIYFSLPEVPPEIAAFDLINPVLHLLEYERHAFDPGYPVSEVSLLYPSLLAAGFLMVGVTLNRRLRRTPHQP